MRRKERKCSGGFKEDSTTNLNVVSDSIKNENQKRRNEKEMGIERKFIREYMFYFLFFFKF